MLAGRLLAASLSSCPGNVVHGDDSTPAISTTNNVVATSDAHYLETSHRQDGNPFRAGYPWAPAHAAIVMR